MKRRGFFKRFGTVATLALLGNPCCSWSFTSANKKTSVTKKEIRLNELTLSDFATHLGNKFSLSVDNTHQFEIELIEATSLGKNSARPSHLAAREPFSIIFRVPKEAGLSQRIYRLEHNQMGGFEIFLVPIGLAEDGLRCEAIFN